MAIKRYIANADTTITNAYKANLTTRGTGSNMGESDILESFFLYGQATSGSSEQQRILIKFPCSGTTAGSLLYDRGQGNIPVSGGVSFYLRMFNARHSTATPKDFTLAILPLQQAWNEGTGLDMENYTDLDAANWINAKTASSGPTAWTSQGGDYYDDISSSFSVTFDTGFEDLEVDITTLVEQWISSSDNADTAFDMGSKGDHGVLIKMSGTYEDGEVSYYTKKFFARGSQFFFKKPVIEARWDSSKKDDRANFYYSSSLASGDDNLNTIYLYNYVRGQLKNIPGPSSTRGILVSIHSGTANNRGPDSNRLNLSVGGNVAAAADLTVTGGYVSTGIYSATFAFTGSETLTKIFDVWHTGTQGASSYIEYFTGTINPQGLSGSYNTWGASMINPSQQFVSNITNLKPYYSRGNTAARLRLYTRKKDWSPTIYTVAADEMPISLVEDAYYKVMRVDDNETAIQFGTGSDYHTRVSFDISGSYFDLDMSLLESDSAYKIKFVYYLNNQYIEQPEEFRFKVVD